MHVQSLVLYLTISSLDNGLLQEDDRCSGKHMSRGSKNFQQLLVLSIRGSPYQFELGCILFGSLLFTTISLSLEYECRAPICVLEFHCLSTPNIPKCKRKEVAEAKQLDYKQEHMHLMSSSLITCKLFAMLSSG